MADYSKLSTEDLLALKSGDMSKVSTEGLLALKSAPRQKTARELYDPSRQWGSGAAKQLEHAAYEGGGKVTDITGSPALGYAANVGIQAVPALLGGSVAPSAAPVMQQGARKLMQSANKPAMAALETGEAQRGIETLLKEGINVSEGGVNTLRSNISGLNKQIADAIANSGATVSKSDVTQKIGELLRKAKQQVNPDADLNAIRTAYREFVNHPLLQNLQDIPVALAQELKKGTYRALEGKYGEVGKASDEAQKAMARGLREGVSKAVPEVAELNAKDADMIAALNIANRRVLQQGNNNPGGLAFLTETPKAALGFLADRSALFKSLLARAMYSGAREIPTAAGAAAGGTAGMLTNEAER